MGSNASLFQSTSSLIQAGGNLAIGIGNAGAYRSKGTLEKQIAEQNNRFAEEQAEDAIERGQRGASKAIKESRKTIGAQRAALAAQGIEVNANSALEVQYDTKRLGELDAITIKNNAWQEAWGYKMQGLNARMQGIINQSTANYQANNTLLAGGMNALASGVQAGYYYYNGSKNTPTISPTGGSSASGKTPGREK